MAQPAPIANPIALHPHPGAPNVNNQTYAAAHQALTNFGAIANPNNMQLRTAVRALINVLDRTIYDSELVRHQDSTASWAAVQGLIAAIQAAPAAPGPQINNIKVALPEPFKGSKDRARYFLRDVLMYYATLQQHNPARQFTDEEKILTALGLCQDKAAQWASELKNDFLGPQPRPARVSDWNIFRQEFERRFADPDEPATLRKRIQEIRQTKSVAEFLDEWKDLITRKGYTDDDAVKDLFLERIKERVLREMISRGMPNDLEGVYDLARRIDHSQFMAISSAKKKEGQDQTQTQATNTTQRRNATPAATIGANAAVKAEPVNRIRGKISLEEKNRRRANGLCLYCAQAGHFAANCPQRTVNNVDESQASDDTASSVNNISSTASSTIITPSYTTSVARPLMPLKEDEYYYDQDF